MPSAHASDTPAAVAQVFTSTAAIFKLTVQLAAERDRYYDALAAIVHAPFGEMTAYAMQRLAREALESRA